MVINQLNFNGPGASSMLKHHWKHAYWISRTSVQSQFLCPSFILWENEIVKWSINTIKLSSLSCNSTHVYTLNRTLPIVINIQYSHYEKDKSMWGPDPAYKPPADTSVFYTWWMGWGSFLTRAVSSEFQSLFLGFILLLFPWNYLKNTCRGYIVGKNQLTHKMCLVFLSSLHT